MNRLGTKLVAASAYVKHQTLAEMWHDPNARDIKRRLGRIVVYKGIGSILTNALIGNYTKDSRFMARGYEQIVYRAADDSHVEKLLMKTVGSSASEAQVLAEVLQNNSDTAKYYLGDYWTDTEFHAIVLPKRLGRHAVLAVQPMLRPVSRFDSVADMLQHSTDGQYMAQCADLLARINDLYEDTGLLPDLGGKGNIITLDNGTGIPSIQIVDTIPETPTKLDSPSHDPNMSRRIMHFQLLDAWRSVVTEYIAATNDQTVQDGPLVVSPYGSPLIL